MGSDYLAIVVFAIIAIAEPVGMLLSSIMIRRADAANPVLNGNYESAERSTGRRTTVMNEYLHYFPMFLSYEIVIAVMLIWVVGTRSMTLPTNVAILALFIVGFVFQALVILLSRGRV